MTAGLGHPGELGPALATSRSAEIFAWGEGQVLKLFRAGQPVEGARRERLNALAAFAGGATSVACGEEVTVAGRAGIVMQRLSGETLTIASRRSLAAFRRLPDDLARLHVRVHAATAPGLPDIRQVIEAMLDRPALSFLSADQRDRLRAHVSALPGGDTLLHMDFHSENVMVTADGQVVIDWATAARGDVGADLAMTRFLFRDAELFPGISRVEALLYTTLRRIVGRGYRKAYLRRTGVSRAAFERRIAPWRLPILVWRLATWEAPGEVSRLRRIITTGAEALPEPPR